MVLHKILRAKPRHLSRSSSFIYMVPVTADKWIHVVKLNGTKICHIDHGKIVVEGKRENNSFLRTVANILRENGWS